MLKEIEEEELLFQSKKRRRAIRQAATDERKEGKEGNQGMGSEVEKEDVAGDGAVKVEEYKGARFY